MSLPEIAQRTLVMMSDLALSIPIGIIRGLDLLRDQELKRIKGGKDELTVAEFQAKVTTMTSLNALKGPLNYILPLPIHQGNHSIARLTGIRSPTIP